jgi:hypothetical protein
MHGDTTEEATVATVDADGSEEYGGAKDIFEDEDVMMYLKAGDVMLYLACEGHTACFRFTIGGGECNCRFKPWWPDVWFVTVYERLLTLQCHSCNHCQSWDWTIGGA